MFKKNFKPFRDRSRGGGTLVVFQSQRITDLANGDDVVYSDTTLERKCPPLPPPEHFSLQNQIDAGVPLKEVNSVVFGPSETDVETQVSTRLDELEKQEVENPKTE